MPTPIRVFEEQLSRSAAGTAPGMHAQLHKRLDEREQRVHGRVLDLYRAGGHQRWFDALHIAFSTHFAVHLVQAADVDRLVVPAVMLHDIGYTTLPELASLAPFEARIRHMQEGVPLAARILVECNYTPAELEKILGMIAGHDNPYIGLPIRGAERLALRDCDRAWVMHPVSFYKDLFSHPQMDFKDFLRQRIYHFFGSRQPFGSDWQLENEPGEQLRVEIPAYPSTRNLVALQINRRIREFENHILDSEEVFEKFFSSHLASEPYSGPDKSIS